MLPLRHPTTEVHPCQCSLLEALLEEPFPQTPNDLWQLEQPLSAAAAQVVDPLVLAPLTRAHDAEAFVTQAMAQARAQSPVPLVPKGFRVTRVLLRGGTRILFETPSLREDRRGCRGRRRRTRGPSGTGGSPVLEALGIADRVSPATRSEVALHVGQAASYRAAAARLARRGLACDVSRLVRSSRAPAEASLCLRDAALAAALRVPVPRDGPLAGTRVRVRLDGGRVRTRRTPRGRTTAKGRHGFSAPWREPRGLVIAILDEQGQPDRLRLPLDDGLIGDAEAIWALRLGSVRRRGAASADVVEGSADGAAWRWKRLGRLSTLAEMPAAKGVEGLDCSHASPSLSETIATGRHRPTAQRQALDKRLRHAVRHHTDGVEVVPEAVRALATTQRSKAITRALGSVETPAHRRRSVTLEARTLPIGAGQGERAGRRVVTLRFKAPGSCWRETTVSGLRHLRAAFKAGRWDEVMRGGLTGTCHMPRFEPVGNAAPQRSAAAQERETPPTFVKPRKKAA
jgi:hypothetical protein